LLEERNGSFLLLDGNFEESSILFELFSRDIFKRNIFTNW
jgi:hypothetical protein